MRWTEYVTAGSVLHSDRQCELRGRRARGQRSGRGAQHHGTHTHLQQGRETRRGHQTGLSLCKISRLYDFICVILSLSDFMSVSLPSCLFACQSVCFHVCVSVSLSFFISVSLSLSLCMCLSLSS